MLMSVAEAKGYLAGMIDGEGWVGATNPTKPSANRAVRISNTDPDLIEALKEVCDLLGITYSIQNIPPRNPKWSQGWSMNISGRDNMQVISTLPLRAARKRARLDRALASFRVPLDPEELQRLRDEGLGRPEIARQLGVGIKKVRIAMERHGIQPLTYEERAVATWRTRRDLYGKTGRS
jgi:hypothetical protein